MIDATAAYRGCRVPHSYSYTPDAAKSLVLLAADPKAWNQTWHVPTAANPPTGREFIAMVAREFGVPVKYTVVPKPVLRLAGLFDSNVRSSYEMLYQNQFAYVFDSGKFNRAYGLAPTSYAEGIRATAAVYRREAPATNQGREPWRCVRRVTAPKTIGSDSWCNCA